MRRGAILIIVAGLAVLLASLALTFLVLMRTDAAESAATQREVQARLMLVAACTYIQESSRLGWDLSPRSQPTWAQRYPSLAIASDLGDPVRWRMWRHLDQNDDGSVDSGAIPDELVHEETFGWIDVRNGEVGPNTNDYDGDGRFDARWSKDLVIDLDGDGSADAPAWPAPRSFMRAPMQRLTRPPSAIRPLAAPNPIDTDLASPVFGMPLLRQPDPLPVVDNGWTKQGDAVSTTNWQAFRDGDRRPVPESTGRGWFRIFRDGPATFVITCGGGGTRGYRDWREVRALGATGEFNEDEGLFRQMLQEEARLWYRVEWNAAIEAPNLNPPGHSAFSDIGRNLPGSINTVGTISWIQRLREAPTLW